MVVSRLIRPDQMTTREFFHTTASTDLPKYVPTTYYYCCCLPWDPLFSTSRGSNHDDQSVRQTQTFPCRSSRHGCRRHLRTNEIHRSLPEKSTGARLIATHEGRFSLMLLPHHIVFWTDDCGGRKQADSKYSMQNLWYGRYGIFG